MEILLTIFKFSRGVAERKSNSFSYFLDIYLATNSSVWKTTVLTFLLAKPSLDSPKLDVSLNSNFIYISYSWLGASSTPLSCRDFVLLVFNVTLQLACGFRHSSVVILLYLFSISPYS